MKTLQIADGLLLRLDFATKTAAILAQRRKGKTYTASVLAEEMVTAKQPFVALDPTGAWWGLRASADAKGAGLPVVVLGGQHGDVPLERTGGRLIADLVVDEPGYYVIDFSLFESGEAERQFAVDFAERLYRAKAQPGKDFALHLFVDEADRFIPQQIRKGANETSARLLGAFEAIVRRGGLRGLGTTLISQRAAVVNKNVLEMLDILIALRTIGPNDRAAIGAYIDAHGTKAEREELLGSLASLDIGEAWVWEPGAEPPLFQRIRVRKRTTFNSSATPKPGERRAEPRRLAAVDLAKLQERMAATIEKAKADDPRELRKQIADLRKQLAANGPNVSVVAGPKTPILTDADRALLEKVGDTIAEAASLMHEDLVLADQRFRADIERALGEYGGNIALGVTTASQSIDKLLSRVRVVKILDKLSAVAPPAPAIKIPHEEGSSGRVAPRVATARPVARATSEGAVKGGKFRAMLVALAQAGRPLSDTQIAARAVMALSGTFDKYLSQQRASGWVDGTRQALAITPAGLEALGPFDPLPTGDALQAHWLGELGAGKRSEMLRVLIAAYPRPLSDAAVAERADMALSGTFDKYLSQLRRLQLVVGDRQGLIASEELFS